MESQPKLCEIGVNNTPLAELRHATYSIRAGEHSHAERNWSCTGGSTYSRMTYACKRTSDNRGRG
jgi:hypothetical protein